MNFGLNYCYGHIDQKIAHSQKNQPTRPTAKLQFICKCVYVQK